MLFEQEINHRVVNDEIVTGTSAEMRMLFLTFTFRKDNKHCNDLPLSPDFTILPLEYRPEKLKIRPEHPVSYLEEEVDQCHMHVPRILKPA